MTLQIQYDSRDGIPEGMEDHYSETDDGTFRLDAEGLKTEQDVANVKEALDKERKLRREAEKKANQLPDDFSQDEWEKLKALQDKKDEGETSEEENLELKRLKNKKEELENTVQELSNSLEKTKKKDGLEQALRSVNVLPSLMDGAKALLMPKLKVVKENGEFQAIDDETGKPVSEMVKDWAETDQGKSYIQASDTSGGGNRKSGGGSGGGEFSHIKSKADFKNRAEKSKYVSKYGQEKYLNLPVK